MSGVQVTVNGVARALPADASVADVVADLVSSPAGVAVAVDARVVPRGDWPTHRLADGASVEILRAMQGG